MNFTLTGFLLILFGQSQAAIKFEEAKNAENVTQFNVIDSMVLEMPNHHRNTIPSLKLSINGRTFESLHQVNTTSWFLKLNETTSLIEISVSQANENVTEYNLLWQGIDHHVNQEICIHYGHNSASWYAGHQTTNTSWPMDTKKKMGKVQFNRMLEFERLSVPTHYPREFQFILEHLLINSDGFAVHLDQYQPLFIRRDAAGTEQVICFSVDIDTHYYERKLFKNASDLDLKLRLFASTNIRAVTDYVVHQSPYISKPSEIPKNLDLFRYPIWFSEEVSGWTTMGDHLLAFLNDLSAHGFSSKGQLVLEYYNWVNYTANYTVNKQVFPHFQNMSQTLTGKGMTTGAMLNYPHLTLTRNHPETHKYVLHTQNDYPLYNIDLSKPEATTFYSSMLSTFSRENNLDTFWLKSYIFDVISTKFYDSLYEKYTSLQVPKYIEVVLATNRTVVAEFAYKSQHLPAFTRVIDYYVTTPHQLLQELIPTMLTASIAGYSFLVPFSIGGIDPFRSNKYPLNEEVYIRMLQATTFMPSMSFTKTPLSFSNKTVELTKKYMALHLEHSETIIELAKKRISEGSPILRPMWYAMPDDTKAFPIGDQFMLGENIVVAPVVTEGQRERSVYLPSGKWTDQHGKAYSGPGQFTVLAPLEELPYFKKVQQ